MPLKTLSLALLANGDSEPEAVVDYAMGLVDRARAHLCAILIVPPLVLPSLSYAGHSVATQMLMFIERENVARREQAEKEKRALDSNDGSSSTATAGAAVADAKPASKEPGSSAEGGDSDAEKGIPQQQSAYNEETGEINWDCPCLGGMGTTGPCAPEFRDGASCPASIFRRQRD